MKVPYGDVKPAATPSSGQASIVLTGKEEAMKDEGAVQ